VGTLNDELKTTRFQFSSSVHRSAFRLLTSSYGSLQSNGDRVVRAAGARRRLLRAARPLRAREDGGVARGLRADAGEARSARGTFEEPGAGALLRDAAVRRAVRRPRGVRRRRTAPRRARSGWLG